jgi:hypothetical protein
MNGRSLGIDVNCSAGRYALYGAKGHEQGAGVPETHHLGGQGRCTPPLDLCPGANRQSGHAAARFDEQARDRRNPPGHHQGLQLLNGFDEVVQDAVSRRDSGPQLVSYRLNQL